MDKHGVNGIHFTFYYRPKFRVRTCFNLKLDTSFAKQLLETYTSTQYSHVVGERELLLHCAMHPACNNTRMCYGVFRFTTFGTVSETETLLLVLYWCHCRHAARTATLRIHTGQRISDNEMCTRLFGIGP